MPNLGIVFITGLLTGGLTCLAIQGGLLTTLLANRGGQEPDSGFKKAIFPVFLFLGFRLFGYTVLGFLLGMLGSAFQLSLTMRAWLQGAVAIFMLGNAMNLLQVHPVFRYFSIQPPKFLTKLVRNESRSSKIFAPATLGLTTVLIPCGTTQAMMALALSTASPLWGAAVLFVFISGTMPLFFLLGIAVTQAKHFFQKHFLRIAGASVVLVAIFSLDGALALGGSPLTIQSLGKNLVCSVSICEDSALASGSRIDPSNEVTIKFESNGYKVDNPVIKAGQLVKLKLVNESGYGCIQDFTIPKLGLEKIVQVGKSDILSFTAPSQPGVLMFTCSMGMFQSALKVI